MKVAVLMGGSSSEREVSLKSGAQVAAALRRLGHEVMVIDPAANGLNALSDFNPDAVFIALHGRFGEDGCIQGALEMMGLRYTGSSVLSSAIAMDKTISKALFDMSGIPTPPYVVVSRRHDPRSALELALGVGIPCVVKPSSQGSTVGISIVKESSALEEALKIALDHDEEALVEKFIQGTEVTVGVVGKRDPQALPVLEIVPKNEFYDWESKYTPGMSEHIIPARISEAAQEECQRLALRAHAALKCRGYSRVDMIVEPEGRVWVLEVNTLPGLTEVSLLPDAARAEGIAFDELIEILLNTALED
ncbi:MAG TPA: D-alanine--D-alanine ligase [Firmicutes bacterium]|jgi:D-alanine-D-alanine ligase|nr:D-alanine--D-alanine ligase [Bacillota bacterium]